MQIIVCGICRKIWSTAQRTEPGMIIIRVKSGLWSGKTISGHPNGIDNVESLVKVLQYYTFSHGSLKVFQFP